MKYFVPQIERPFVVRGTEVRPDDPPGLYLQKLARITLDEMFQLVGVLTTDGILLECNRAALEAGGLTRDDVIGKPFWETYWWTCSPKTQGDLRDAIARAAQGEAVRYDTEVYGRKGGTETMVMDFTLIPVKDQQGRIVFLLPEGRDITAKKAYELEIARQRRESEQKLRASREQLQNIVNASPFAVFLVDGDFRICEANPVARTAFGDIPNLIGRDFEEVMHILWPKAYADEIVALYRHTLETGETFHTPERIQQRNDRASIEYYEGQIHRIPMPDGRHGIVCYFRDISAQVLSRLALETADRQKDEFLAMLAHELRNPLAPIGNASEILLRMFANDPRAELAIGMIKRQVTHLTRLVDDLLDVSRITQGRIELRRRPVELGTVITQAIETVEPQLREKQHRISVTTSGSMLLYVNGDFARLVQCVANILTNAVKYTEPRGEIWVRTRSEDANAVVEISDTGAGIPPELLPRIFDLFVQSDRTLDRSQGGLGIGLAVVKRLVKMQGGDVFARSPGVGQGSTFEIRLPQIERPDTAAAELSQLKPEPKRVLIVDDNADAADSLALLLKMQGHQTEAVYTGREALERITTFKPDVALLDIGLPEMNGYEIAQHVRAMPAVKNIRLIALTGYGQGDDRERTRKAGFDDHLVKPVDLAVLERSLESVARANPDSPRI